MQIKRREMLALLGVTPILLGASSSPVTVYPAKRIITIDAKMPSARFVAVADDLILGVANTLPAIKRHLGGRSFQVDNRFENAVLMPGLIDPHVHPIQSAIMLNLPFVAPEDWVLPSGTFKGAQTPADYHVRLKDELARSDANPFICWGHHELFHGPIDRAALDQIAPDRQIIIWQRSFHEVILNSAAMGAWGFAERTAFDAAVATSKVDPNHANFDKGIFAETALLIAIEHLRPHIVTPAKIQSGLKGMQQMMLRSGVTTIADLATGIIAGFNPEASMISAAFDRPDSPSRVMLMPMANNVAADVDLNIWVSEMQSRWSRPKIRIDRRIKLFADGAFFSLSMMMNPPGYTDGHIGKWITEPVVMTAQLRRFWDAGFSLHIHVNGDQGLDVVLDGLSALGKRTGQTITLEHLGYSTQKQNARIARMGLMASVQPNYIRVLGDVYAEHGLGPERAAYMNRLGSLEKLGVPLGLHSDFNMAPIDPFYLAWVAANRVTIGGNVQAPKERLSIDKALRAITIEAAQVIGMDGLVGSISVGKKADFAVLADDPYALGRAKLRETKIKGVVFDGRYHPA
jgi:predicted amidohydrolase YtcJ